MLLLNFILFPLRIKNPQFLGEKQLLELLTIAFYLILTYLLFTKVRILKAVQNDAKMGVFLFLILCVNSSFDFISSSFAVENVLFLQVLIIALQNWL